MSELDENQKGVWRGRRDVGDDFEARKVLILGAVVAVDGFGPETRE